MRECAIIGTGMIRFGKYPERPLADIAFPAVLEALAEARIDPTAVEAAWCGSALSGMMAGQRILARIGMSGIPIVNVENACASSASALHAALHAIGSGEIEVALVIGAEKLTRFGGGAISLDAEDPEVARGLNMPGLYAMRARRYCHDLGLAPDALAEVAVKARRHGALNPLAQLQSATTVEAVLESRAIADPLTLFQCCPTGDGAAAAIVTSASHARRLGAKMVTIATSELTSGRWTAGFRDMTSAEITRRGAGVAYEQAGIGPDDIDVAEVHDAFSIAELLYYEAFDFAPRGTAIELLRSGATSVGGRIPINPSGGLLSKGHPVGASGIAQIVELVRQLQGRCGQRQVDGAKVGLAHVTGGGIAGFDHGACAIHILKR